MAQTALMTSVRAALEATRGTAVNPTRILEIDGDSFSHEPDVALIRPRQSRASFFQFYSAAAGREMHKLTIPGTALSYQQLSWLGTLFFKGLTTGVGAGTDKTYAFVPHATTDDLKSATLEWAYDLTLSASQPGQRLPYVVGDELTITWDKRNVDGISWSGSFHSPKAASQITAFGGTPTSLASVLMSPIGTQVYIDTATIGTTADNYVVSAAFHKTIGWSDLDTLNLSTAAQDTFRAAAPDSDLTLTRYYVNDSELDAFHAKTIRKIRVRTTGPVLGASNYAATLDFYGVPAPDGYRTTLVDGIKMEQIKYLPVYDTTAATDHSLTVVTAEATIT